MLELPTGQKRALLYIKINFIIPSLYNGANTFSNIVFKQVLASRTSICSKAHAIKKRRKVLTAAWEDEISSGISWERESH